MMSQLSDALYSRALSCAAAHDLTNAVRFARYVLAANPDNQNALRLLGLCLYELGSPLAAPLLSQFPEYASEPLLTPSAKNIHILRKLADNAKWLQAEKLARRLRHQSVRVLLIRACFLAAANRFSAAAPLFAEALNKDRGNKHIPPLLAESVRRHKPFFFF